MPRTWPARFVAAEDPIPAPLLASGFTLDPGHGAVADAVLHVSALGVVEPFLDGRAVSEDLLTPGWSSYEWRLRYRSYDVTRGLGTGAEHALGLALGNGWAVGRLAWVGGARYYATEPAGFAQLEIVFADGHRQVVGTDETWRATGSATLVDDLYGGQTVDARAEDPAWAAAATDRSGWGRVRGIEVDPGRLTPAVGPPARRQEIVAAQRVWSSPSGRTLVDFGQNLVGWVRFGVRGALGQEIVLRHAEVLEHDELGVRPLRGAAATDRFVLSGGADTFEPTKTFHGFRYVDVDGWPGELQPGDLEAVVVHSELRRTGEFGCSDELVNQLHHNVVWGQKGNFLDVPTDCPQRDERLGWTGDLAVFGPTAAYLFDVADFLRDWLRDLDAEQRSNSGIVPFVVPDVLKYTSPGGFGVPDSTAVWGDVAVWLPWSLYQAYADTEALAEAYPASVAHVDRVETLLDDTGLWTRNFQFGDWLDPDAPPDDPAAAKAPPAVVATACVVRSARTLARIAEVLDRPGDARRYAALADRVAAAFRTNYVAADGTVEGDCATVYALAIEFEVLGDDDDLRRQAGNHLARVVAATGYRISTGFAGTPFVTDALTRTGHLDDAYRLLLQQECPSWLYPVTMGATTVWERWDSMLPDGSINPGEMTSFNHYALGAVADWLHRVVAGLSPLEPGYARSLIAPRPGGGLTWAQGALDTPHGRLSVSWRRAEGALEVAGVVPAGTTAVLRLPGSPDRELSAGEFQVSVPDPA